MVWAVAPQHTVQGVLPEAVVFLAVAHALGAFGLAGPGEIGFHAAPLGVGCVAVAGAAGGADQAADDDLRGALSVSLPSTRFSNDLLAMVVGQLGVVTAGVERAFTRAGVERAFTREAAAERA
ncbi:hypothetical protein [Streptomyces sp. NPDC093808]|uniref:hypothetical protein n=1 Tax=unclassified Streptomyces TaxID=2593676 RepID=UPI00344CD055